MFNVIFEFQYFEVKTVTQLWIIPDR